MVDDKTLLQKEIDELNNRIKQLAYRLGGVLDVDCNLGVCSYDPNVDDLHQKMKEVQDRKILLEKLMANLEDLP